MKDSAYTLQTFRVGSRQFAIHESEIATVAEWRQPTPLPHAPQAVMGIVSLQGRMLTVLDLSKLTETENAANGTPQHIIALRGDEQLALAVDDIEDKIKTYEVPLEGKSEGSGVTLGVLDHQGQRVEIVNVKGLFSSAIQGRERRQRRF
jgi:purine-binding chemotaxis protein CheW